MNYTETASSCRVDFFKESGKWYCTEALMLAYDESGGPAAALENACRSQLKGRLSGMWAVCLDPYHENSFPVMVKVP